MRRQSGFTLIELMIVVVVIAVLSAIAIPAYSEYVMRSRITEAVSGLSEMRVRLEQFFQDNRTYASGCATLPSASYFSFACSNLSATTYTVTATGSGAMSGFVYTVNQSNTRQTTGVPSGWTSSTTCWVTRKNGAC